MESHRYLTSDGSSSGKSLTHSVCMQAVRATRSDSFMGQFILLPSCESLHGACENHNLCGHKQKWLLLYLSINANSCRLSFHGVGSKPEHGSKDFYTVSFHKVKQFVLNLSNDINGPLWLLPDVILHITCCELVVAFKE